MRKIVLISVAAAMSLLLVSCGKNDKGIIPVAADTKAPVTEVSAAEKAEVDALGSDLLKLVEMVDNSEKTKQLYAENKLATAFDQASPVDAKTVDEAFAALKKPGWAKVRGFAARTRLAK